MEHPRAICHVRIGSQRTDDLIWHLGTRRLAFFGGKSPREAVEPSRQVVRDTARLTAAVREIFDDTDRFASLRSEVAFLADHGDEVLGRWAAVMLGSEVYAEVIDRHVELGGDVAWIAGLFDSSSARRRAPTEEGSQQPGRRDRERARW
jgi:hypothetical protein